MKQIVGSASSVLLLLALSACMSNDESKAQLTAASSAEVSALPSVEKIIAEYKQWSRLTSEPRNVSPFLWSLCRAPTQPETEFLQSQHGDRYLNVYVNDMALIPITKKERTIFPVGSIIVKEKLLSPETTSAEAWGIMLKREKGHNPNGGDWEYIYREKSGRTWRGQEQLMNCQSCHSTQRNRLCLSTLHFH